MILQWLTSPEWANLVKALLHTLWQGAVVALLLGFALRWLAHPVARYRCSLAALAVVLLAGMVTWAALNRPLPPAVSVKPAPQLQPVNAPAAPSPLPPLVVKFSKPEPKPAALPWSAWLALVWLAGAAAMIFRAGFQVAGAERLRRSSRSFEDARIAGQLEEARRAVGLARRVRMAVTDKLTSPAVVGVLVPTLILPLSLTTTLTPEQIRFVLLHELAHIRRGDYLASLFQLFAEALLFFNPAVWWISRQMRIEREACCDTLAIELSGAPVDYARTLVHVAENVLRPAPAAALAFGDKRGPSSLTDRVQRLLVPGYRPALRLTWRAMLVALFVGGGLLFLSALGTRATVAAILSPQERIERIEKKMTELGETPGPENFSGNDANAPQVKLSGQVRTADGTPVPKWVWLNVNSSVKHSSSSTAISARNGFFTNSTRAGSILIGAEVANFAPAFIGPLNGYATNRIEQLEIVLQRGFDVPLQLVDFENGQPVAGARVATMFWMFNNGFQSHAWKSGADGSVTLTHCADLPLDVTVSVPGYETVKKRFDHLRAGEPLRVELRRGVIESSVVLDKTTGQPVAGAELHLIYQADLGKFEWNDPMQSLGKTDASGAFVLNQFRPGVHYFLGVSAPGHESVILDHVPGGKSDLVVRLGPELVVRGHVIGSLEGLQIVDKDYCLSRTFSDVFGNNSYGSQEWVRLRVTNGVATFQFTNRASGPVTLTSETGYREERDVTAPIADWVVNLSEARKTDARFVPKREVIFRFQHPSGVPPCGTVEMSIPDNLEKNHRTAHSQEMEITNGEVRVQIPIGGWTDIEAKRMVGYWFNHWTVGNNGLMTVEVTNGSGPLVVDIPLIPAGAIYATARNADGTPAGGVFFGVTELKRAPGRDQNSLDSGGDNFSSEAPRHWVSGPLPLGGTYQIHAWRGNSFCVSKPVKLTEANPDAEIELQFPTGKTFAGVVLDAEGQSLRGAELKVSFNLPDNHGFGLKSVFTDGRGQFRLENLTPELGRYAVEANAPGLMTESVKLNFGSQPQTIRLQRGRSLAGRVVEAGTGYPIPGMEIRALDYEQNKLPMLTTHTDAEGRFEFTTLGDVNYTLYPDGGELLDRPKSGNQKFRADGRTNLTLRVKLYEWSKLKPKVPVATADSTNAIGVVADPNFRVALRALQQQTGVESLAEPEVITSSSGRGINRITMTNISVATNAFVAKAKASGLVQDGKLLYEMGKLAEAEAKLKSALAADPNNAVAKYYLGQVKTNWVGAKTNTTYSGLGRQEIIKRIHEIRLDRAEFKAAPLVDVMLYLSQQAKANDPERKGVNFLINAAPDRSGQPNLTADSPVTTDPLHTNVLITIDPPPTNAPLGDVLDAVVRGASEPIYYSIQDFAIVISVGKPSQPLYSRVFKVDTNTFYSGLKQTEGAGASAATNSVTVLARKFFTGLGVNLNQPPGKAVFYNDRLGRMYVKATEQDLDTIERALSTLNNTPVEVHIKSWFVEAPKGAMLPNVNLHGFQKFAGSSNSAAHIVGILNATNAEAVMQSLQASSDFVVLGEPEVTTLSGRQSQMRATTIVPVGTDYAVQEKGVISTDSIVPQMSKVETGPVLDVVPYVLSDGYTINLALIPSLTEFLGYDKSTNTTTAYNRAGEKIDVPTVIPNFRVRQVVATVNLWDGQTVVLGGLPEKVYVSGQDSLDKNSKPSNKELMVFITATIVDSTDKRVHPDAEIPFAQDTVPPQPAPPK